MQEIISSTFDFPAGECPSLRASIIPRWSIIKMAKEQSVAEHQYNVAIITGWLCHLNSFMPQADIDKLVREALFHDTEEIKTGDIPSPAKVKTDGRPTSPVIKLADVMEAYIFARDNCIDTDEVKKWLMGGLKARIIKLLQENGLTPHDIKPLIKEIYEE